MWEPTCRIQDPAALGDFEARLSLYRELLLIMCVCFQDSVLLFMSCVYWLLYAYWFTIVLSVIVHVLETPELFA